jgi:hypothetical protein
MFKKQAIIMMILGLLFILSISIFSIVLLLRKSHSLFP